MTAPVIVAGYLACGLLLYTWAAWRFDHRDHAWGDLLYSVALWPAWALYVLALALGLVDPEVGP